MASPKSEWHADQVREREAQMEANHVMAFDAGSGKVSPLRPEQTTDYWQPADEQQRQAEQRKLQPQPDDEANNPWSDWWLRPDPIHYQPTDEEMDFLDYFRQARDMARQLNADMCRYYAKTRDERNREHCLVRRRRFERMYDESHAYLLDALRAKSSELLCLAIYAAFDRMRDAKFTCGNLPHAKESRADLLSLPQRVATSLLELEQHLSDLGFCVVRQAGPRSSVLTGNSVMPDHSGNARNVVAYTLEPRRLGQQEQQVQQQSMYGSQQRSKWEQVDLRPNKVVEMARAREQPGSPSIPPLVAAAPQKGSPGYYRHHLNALNTQIVDSLAPNRPRIDRFDNTANDANAQQEVNQVLGAIRWEVQSLSGSQLSLQAELIVEDPETNRNYVDGQRRLLDYSWPEIDRILETSRSWICNRKSGEQ